MAVGTFFPKTDLFYSTVNVVNREQTITGLIAALGGDCCPEGCNDASCPIINGLNYLLGNVGDITVGKLVTTPEYFGFINGFFDVLNNYANIQDESKNGFVSDSETSYYNFREISVEFVENTQYKRWSNTFTSNMDAGENNISSLVTDATGGVSQTIFSVNGGLSNVAFKIEFYSVGTVAFNPGTYIISLFKKTGGNSGIPVTTTKVADVFSFNFAGNSVLPGNKTEYQFNQKLPANYFTNFTNKIDFTAVPYDGIQDWDIFRNTVLKSDLLVPENATYYLGLCEGVAASEGKAFIGITVIGTITSNDLTSISNGNCQCSPTMGWQDDTTTGCKDCSHTNSANFNYVN